MSERIILCVTPEGCTCGAPASTPAGMHHCDCAVHPGWCGQAGCLPCEQNGRVPDPTTSEGRIEMSEHSAEGGAAIARELRLRLQSAEDMLKEAQRRVTDAEEALDAHMESCSKPDVRSKAHSLNDCWCGMAHRRDDSPTAPRTVHNGPR